MNQSTSEYRYEPLNHSRTEIRLLTLYPGSFESQLVTKLKTISLAQVSRDSASSVEWDALSYAWEQQIPSEPILIDGKRFNVTKNVEAALRHLRHSDVTICLWIDSVCMNQNDDKEKSHQVQQMHHIYRRACRVFVWLGPSNVASDQVPIACDSLKRFFAARMLPSGAADLSLDQYYEQQKPGAACKNAFNSLLSRPWFARLWVIQEAALAKDLVVCIGFQRVTWEDFAIAAACFIANPDLQTLLTASSDILFNRTTKFRLPLTYHSGLTTLRIISQLRDRRNRNGSQLVPSRLLHICASGQVSDSRDKIYALFALFPSSIKHRDYRVQEFSPDYTITASVAFRDFTRWCCEQEGNLDVLALKRNVPEERDLREIASWPSWATMSNNTTVDFRANTTRQMFPEENLFASVTHYHERRLAKLQGPRTLVLRGFIIDSVKAHFQFFRLNARNLENMAQSWLEILKDTNLSKHELKVLYGSSTPTIGTMKRLLCASILCERRSSHLWSDGLTPSNNEADIDSLLDSTTSDLSNGGNGAAEAMLEGLAPDSEQVVESFRSAIVTHSGLLAITFRFVRPGDKVCALYGARSLFVLRRNFGFLNMSKEDKAAQRGGHCYQMISGDCLIYGFEDGRGVDKAKALGFVEEDVRLV